MEGKFISNHGKRTFPTFPEDMKMLIFGHVSDQNMTSTLQNVNKECQKITKDSIHVQKYLVAGKKEPQVVHVCTRNEKVTTARVEFKGNTTDFSGLPKWGVYLHGRTFIGYNYSGNKDENILEYSDEGNTFIPFSKTITTYGSAATFISTSIVVTGGVGSDSVEMLKFKEEDPLPIHSICNTKLPMGQVYSHALTSIEERTIVLTGGFHGGTRSSAAYEGYLSEDGNDLKWSILPSMSRARSHHAPFALQAMVYSTGGLIDGVWSTSSEMYKIEERKWSDGPVLPYPLLFPYSVTDKSKKFALITGWKDREQNCINVFIFDEQKIFKELAELKFQNRWQRTVITQIA